MLQEPTIQTALRVLTAITEHKSPDPDDVAIVRGKRAPASDEDTAELACSIIIEAVERRKKLVLMRR